MLIQNLAFELPFGIAARLASGEFCQTGSVIRRAADARIVAHLRAVGLPSLQPVGAMLGLQVGIAALQIAGIAVVERHLRRIDERIDRLCATMEATLSAVHRIERRQWRSVGTLLEQGQQHLLQFQSSEALGDLQAARERLIDCRAAVRSEIGHAGVEDLLRMGRDTEWLLRVDLSCLATELYVYALGEARVFEQSCRGLEEHRKTFVEFRDRMKAIPPAREFLPLKELREGSPDGNPYRTTIRWIADAQEVVDVLAIELEFQASLARVPTAELVEASRGLEEVENAVLVLHQLEEGSGPCLVAVARETSR